ncbi:hypothetical protein BD626DRAFT_513664 [Schizophyllum amplum]|uniref:Uncharacterized protein n=1 Tax=Schizophyllum amplum TaxID=97359 RepID=A0A550BZ51_9AGAR|nr:hypothetical protein BD626DRAFT_513664 [Auriculariopsis ampla]
MADIIAYLASPARPPSLRGIEDLRCGRTPSTYEARQSIEERSKQLRLEQERIDAEKERIDAEKERIDAEQERIDAEQERLNAELERLNGELERLNGELERLSAELQRLLTQRQDIARELEINQALLAPVHRLFPELLSEVFMHAVQDSPIWTQFVVCVLCSVCTTWRAVARDTPSLWTSIDMDYILGMFDPMLHLQLELSRQLPLIRRSSRQTLFEELSDAHLSRRGRALARLRLRNLPTLRVAEVNIDDSCALGALGFLASAPALRDLCICMVYQCTDDEVLSGFPVPSMPKFPCLTRLLLAINNDFPVSAYFAAISQLAPSLRDLEMVANEVSDWEETKPTITCEMPVLRTVDLEHYTHKFLTYITAPALQDVTLHGDALHLGEEDPTESLLDLLSRSRPSLRSFCLNDPMKGSADALLKCLDRLEGLQRLSMEDNEYGATKSPRMAAVLQRLICDENRPPIVPELRSLSVRCRGDDSSCLRPDVAVPLSQVRLSRKEPRVCAGRAVVALE